MKIFGLAVFLLYVSCCLAASNRSILWLISDELIYSSNKGYQACPQLGANTNTSLVTTSYFRISTGSSTDALFYKTLGANDAADGVTYILKTLQLIFISGDSTTPNLFFNLPSFITMDGSNSVKMLASIIPSGTYTTASGSTWLSVRPVINYNYPSSAANTGATASVTFSSVLITDYRSSSTITIIQYQDKSDTTGTGVYNHLYSVIVRTPTSLLTTSTDILVGGCATTGRTAVGANQVVSDAAIGSCSVSSASDSSLSSSTACTDSGLPNAVTAAITSMNTLKSVDTALFGAAGSRFTIAVNFGILITISSVIFSYLN